jgi:hypothetical protein
MRRSFLLTTYRRTAWRPNVFAKLASSTFFLVLFGCGDKTADKLPAPLVERIQNGAPDQGTAVPLPLNGPFRRAVRKIAILNGHLALMIQDAPGLGNVGLYVNDASGLWVLRDFTPDIPSMLSTANGYYWVSSGKGFASFNPTTQLLQGFSPPTEGTLRELIGFEERLLAVVGTNTVLGAKRGGPWTPLATLDAGESLVGIAATPTETCVLSSTSRRVWSSIGDNTKWSERSKIPSNYELIQIVADAEHTYVLGKNAVLIGDSHCSNWLTVAGPPNVDPYFSIAVSGGKIYIASADGVFVFDQHAWTRQEIDPTRSLVRVLRFLDGRLYASHDAGLDESSDYGDHWTPSRPPLDRGIAVIDVRKAGFGEYAGTQAGLFRRKTPEENWTEVALPGESNDSVTALETASDGSLLVAVSSVDPLGNARVLKSSNDGGTFIDITNNLRVPRIARIVWTEPAVFLATPNGVYALPSAQSTWRLDRKGIGDNPIVALCPYGDRGLIAASDTQIWWKSQAMQSKGWEKLNANQPFVGINDVWSDPAYPDVIFASIGNGLLYTTAPRELFHSYSFRPDRHPLPVTLRFGSTPRTDGKSILFLGSNLGAYFVYDDLERHGWAGRLFYLLERYQHDYSDRFWFWPVTVLGAFASAYLIGIACLLLLLAIEMPPLVGRSWLLTLIAKPLTISPPLGRWALFLGYRRRLRRTPSLIAVRRNYFGLSARLPDETQTAPDSSGQVLHAHILKQLKQRNCLLVVGRPGTGKTSVLSKLALLAGEKSSLAPLNKLIPVLIPAEFYKGNLLEAASRVLLERYRIPLDSKEMLIGQVEFGKLLFLFDGLSEVSTDRNDAASEMVHTAGLGAFQKSFFIITSRFFDGLPDVPRIELLPLTQEAIRDVYLPSYQLAPAKEEAVLQQVAQFGRDTSIDALLFAMILSAAQSQETSMTRSQLYEKYFRQALNVASPEKDSEWLGWKYLLESIAGWFSLTRGVRARGMTHFELMDLLLGKDPGRDASEAMAPKLRQYYGIKEREEIDLLARLSSAGILTKSTYWHFAHDSFEEYFCAQRIIRFMEDTGDIPDLHLWFRNPEDFLDIVRYFRESAPSEMQTKFFAQQGLPASWTSLVTAQK